MLFEEMMKDKYRAGMKAGLEQGLEQGRRESIAMFISNGGTEEDAKKLLKATEDELMAVKK